MPKLVINGWFWGRTDTGSGQYLHGLIWELYKALDDWQIILLTPPIYGDYRLPAPPPTVQKIRAPLPFWALNAQLVKLAWEQQVAPHWAQLLHADALFVPYWASPITSPAPVAVTIHDMIPVLLADYASGALARAYTWLVSKSARKADAILTVSQSAADDIIRLQKVPPERVHVTYESLGAPHAPVTDEEELARIRDHYRLPDRYLFYLGGFDPRKNVPLLLEAYARARQLAPDLPPLVLAGRLPDPDDDWFTDPLPIIQRLGLSDHVRVLGFVPDAHKPALYTLADLFLFPSRYEGFGMPPLEAMACGTPAIVADNSSLPEITGGVTPIVPTDDEDALARAILATLANPPAPDALIARANAFTWQETATRTAEVIRAMVRNR
ncbi:MAG TPA: glycosyltransferase family 4 protein [Caldilineae bacterium]|nr:glycosyltransferase family 4 protein [Caldilineae bacterium]HIQ12139.1 glycosyltransferase family 1 protein [Caldilineales bacterium]